MYTVGDVADKYSISQQDINQVREGSEASNVRPVHHDTYTKKIAYGSVSNPSVSEMLYVCHTQYNNLPDNILDKESLRPNIACSISNYADLDSVRNCVCGIIAKVYKKSSDVTGVYKQQIVRIIPQTTETDVSTAKSPENVFISELNPAAVIEGDVLSQGVLTHMQQSVQFYFATELSDMNNDNAVAVMGNKAQYHICQDEVDPDNSPSINKRNPFIIDGVIVPLGVLSSPASCCNLIYPFLRNQN